MVCFFSLLTSNCFCKTVKRIANLNTWVNSTLNPRWPCFHLNWMQIPVMLNTEWIVLGDMCLLCNQYSLKRSSACSSAFCTSSRSVGFMQFLSISFSEAGPIRLFPEARLDYRKHTRLVLMLETSCESCVVVGRGCRNAKDEAIWPNREGLFSDLWLCSARTESACLFTLAFRRSEKWDFRDQNSYLSKYDQIWAISILFRVRIITFGMFSSMRKCLASR